MSSEHFTRSEIPRPPKWLDRLARWICAPHLREILIGDLHERYGAIVITLFTVSYQTMKAAMADPVKTLRNE